MEGRPPLPGQLVTRQTYLPAVLQAEGVHTVYVQAEGSGTYNTSGHIHTYTAYGSKEATRATLKPGTYAWRLRDPVWPGGDPAGYPEGHGYNCARARGELATRQGLARALAAMGLQKYGVETIAASSPHAWPTGETLFVKPNRVNDISERPGMRAQLVNPTDRGASPATPAGDLILQKPERLVAARELADHVSIPTDQLSSTIPYLHTLRVFTPLWLPAWNAPAVELRFTDPHNDIGAFFATYQYLLEPAHVRDRLPLVAQLHQAVHTAFRERYSAQNYLTFDYLILADGSPKLLNALVRGLTPNLEHQPPEVQHLANATADVEAKHLAALALSRLTA